MPLDLSYGDEVTGITVEGQPVSGYLIGLDYAADDTIRAAVVRSAVDGRPYQTDPVSLRFATDRNGFSFSHRDAHTLVIRRNDQKLTNDQWWRRRGLKLLRDSIAPPKRRRRK